MLFDVNRCRNDGLERRRLAHFRGCLGAEERIVFALAAVHGFLVVQTGESSINHFTITGKVKVISPGRGLV